MLSYESLRKQNRSRASERFERVIAVHGRWLSRY